MKLSALILGLGLLLPTLVPAADFEAIEPEMAKGIAARIIERATINEPKVKIEPDPQNANGYHIPMKTGFIVIPQKDLKEGEELAAKFKTDLGAPMGYLLLYKIAPIVDGKQIDLNRLHSLTFSNDQGDQHTLHILLLSTKQVSESDYRLHGYGTDSKPLVDAKFSEGAGDGPVPLSVKLTDYSDNKKEGKLVLTAFGKYQVSFPVADVSQ